MTQRKTTARRQELDSLIAAVISKLPADGPFPGDKRLAWLRLMVDAFDVVYGPDDDFAQFIPEFLGKGAINRAGEVMLRATRQPTEENDAVAPVPSALLPAHSGFDFYVDSVGYARMDGGAPVTAAEVADEMIYDYRIGEARDRDTIIWADGSRGARPGMSFCGPG